jgi:hypothetical protein
MGDFNVVAVEFTGREGEQDVEDGGGERRGV